MLVDELKTIDCSKDREFDSDLTLVLFSPGDERVYRISFGDGSDENPVPGCSRYLYITVSDLDGIGEKEVDGGNLWFKKKDYSGLLNDYKMVVDALNFVDCPAIMECRVLKKVSA